MTEQRRPASFSFAQFPGKELGRPTMWNNFCGIFFLVANDTMWRAMIEAIDSGDKGEGLDSEVADLVEAMEDLRTNDNQCFIDTNLFNIMAFETCGEVVVFQIQCTEEGLAILRQAVQDGADFQGFFGQPLVAFTKQAENLLRPTALVTQNERPASESETNPQGYIRKRKRKDEAANTYTRE